MRKYKVYAKILGYVLPKKLFEVGKCRIEKMSYNEQKKRNFRSLTGWAAKERKMNYVTFPRGGDFRIMRSNFVVSTILKCTSPNEAVGLAESRFDEVIGVLMLYMYHWWKDRYPKRKIRFSEYDYQICKVYEIVDSEEKEIKRVRPISTRAFMCHYPAFNEVTINFNEILKNYLDCKNDVFRKSLIYFINGIKGFNSELPEEKIFLDLFKSIELIVNSFQRRRTNKFRVKLEYASKRLDFNKQDEKKIIEFYKKRNRGDFAHARGLNRRIQLPPQYPSPGYCDIFVDYFNLIDLSQKTIIRYFNYIKDRYQISINPSEHKKFGLEDGLVEILFSGSDREFMFITKEKNRRKLTPLLKKEMAGRFNVGLNQVKVVESKQDKLVIKIFKQ